MSTQPMPMVQVFAPDGTLGDIPYDRLHDALGQGAKIAAKIKAPDGTVGFVPGDRVPDALKAGGQRVALDMHDADGGKKDGFWSKLTAASNPAVAGSNPIVRGLDAAGGAVLGTPGAIYNTVRHPIDTATGLAQSVKGAIQGYADPNLTANAVASVLPEALGQGIGNVAGGELMGAGGNLARAGAEALPDANAVGAALRTPTGQLKPLVKTIAKGAGVGVGGSVGGGWGALVGEHLGTNLADAIIPSRIDAATAAERRAVPLSKSPYPENVAQIEAARKAVAAGVPLSKLAEAVAEPSGVTVIPEPRAALPGDVNLMGSIPRDQLGNLALAGKPGAGAQLQHLGQPILYAPSGAGISNVKSMASLRDLLSAQPGDFTSNQTLNPVGAGGARPIVPGNEFESLFGPEHKEVGDLAEWETGSREGVRVGSDLDKAAKSMFGGKSFDALNQAQKAHILRIAQTQVAVP